MFQDKLAAIRTAWDKREEELPALSHPGRCKWRTGWVVPRSRPFLAFQI